MRKAKPTKIKKYPVDLLPETRAAVLRLLKHRRRATIPELAQELALSTEAVRQQLAQMEREGWLREDCPEGTSGDDKARGRPATTYCLSAAGDDLFPKQYEELSIALLDEITSGLEADALTAVLAAFTGSTVRRLSATTKDRSLDQRLDALRAIYGESDAFIDIARTDDGPALIETNCPYLAVALERPSICSTTVSALQQLTGCEVVREERFQDDDHRCVFQIYEGRRLDRAPRFQWEKPRTRPLAGR